MNPLRNGTRNLLKCLEFAAGSNVFVAAPLVASPGKIAVSSSSAAEPKISVAPSCKQKLSVCPSSRQKLIDKSYSRLHSGQRFIAVIYFQETRPSSPSLFIEGRL